MKLSKECYLINNCKKFKKDNSCAFENKYCIKLFKIDTLLNLAGLTEYQKRHVTLRATQVDISAFEFLKSIETNIDKFVKTGDCLYIYSTSPGNGKTSWALRLIQAYIQKIWPGCELECKALFINVPRFLLAMKSNISERNEYYQELSSNILKADLVVWDEISTNTLTEYEHNNLLSLINTRIDNGQANIYTSNVAPGKLLDKVGERLYSRIINLSKIVEFKDKDKRGLK